jgi:hypothetical protein
LGTMGTLDEGNYVNGDDDDNVLMCGPERRYFDNMMVIDNGKIVGGEILAITIEMVAWKKTFTSKQQLYWEKC